MNAKEYLSQIKISHVKIEQMEKELENLKLLAISSGSLALNPNKVQTSLKGDKLSNEVAKYVDLEQEILKKKLEYMDIRQKIVEEIHCLTDSRYIQILYLHYVDYKRLEEIACIMHKPNGDPYSYDHIYALHGKALIEFEKIYKSHRNPK